MCWIKSSLAMTNNIGLIVDNDGYYDHGKSANLGGYLAIFVF